MAVKPIPDGYPRVTPYLVVDGANEAIEFYKNVIGAEERFRMGGPDGRVGHAELQIGDSVLMLADAYPDMGIIDAKTIGDTPVSIVVYVEDVDKVFAAALEAGAKQVEAVENKFYGDRMGGTVRLIFPLNSKIAFTAEGGVNETMLSRGNDGRAVKPVPRPDA